MQAMYDSASQLKRSKRQGSIAVAGYCKNPSTICAILRLSLLAQRAGWNDDVKQVDDGPE